MAAVYKSIASSGGDYTTLSAAEASIPNSSADDFTLEYIEAMSDNAACAFSISGFTGTILVTVAAPYRCNGAVYGTHAELNYTTDNTTTGLAITSVPNVTVQHLRIVRNTTAAASALICTTCDNVKVLNCVIVRRCGVAGGSPTYFNDCTNVVYAGNNLVLTGFSFAGVTTCAFYRAGAATSTKVYRNKFLYNAGTAKAIVACWGNSAVDAQQNVVIISAGTVSNGGYDTDFGGAFHANSDSNVSSAAADCPGTNANDSESAADVFASVTLNTEDLSYPSHTKMLEQHAGNNLRTVVGTTDNKGVTIVEWFPGSDYKAAIVSNIASVGGDYTTYEAWEAAIPADPVDSYTANGLLEESITTNLTISFSNANSATVRITTSIPHYGRSDRGHVLYNAAGDGPIIISHTGNVIIEKVRILKENTTASSALINKTSGTGTVTVRQVVAYNKNPAASRGMRIIIAGATLLVQNTMIVDEGATSNDLNVCSNGTLTFENNTIFSISGTRDGQIAQYSGTVNQTNNVYLKLAAATVTNVESALYICSGTKTNNSYWSTTTYGTNPITSATVGQLANASVLKDNNASTFDLHFKSVGYMNLVGAGADKSGSYTYDVQGRVRSAWTRGADFAIDEHFVTGPAGVMLTVGGNQFVVT